MFDFALHTGDSCFILYLLFTYCLKKKIVDHHVRILVEKKKETTSNMRKKDLKKKRKTTQPFTLLSLFLCLFFSLQLRNFKFFGFFGSYS